MKSQMIDPYAYALGIIAAFSEVVAAGVKQLALSEPATPAQMQTLLPEAQRIAQRHGVQTHLETDLIETDLFPADVARGMHVLLLYRGDVLAQYMTLKQECERLTRDQAYAGAPRRAVAQGFGRLLSYSEARIDALLAASSAH